MTNFPEKALIGEDAGGLTAQNGIIQNTKHFQGDKRFAMNDFKEAFTVSVTDALDNHLQHAGFACMPLQCKFG